MRAMSDDFALEDLGIDWLTGKYANRKNKVRRELARLTRGDEDE